MVRKRHRCCLVIVLKGRQVFALEDACLCVFCAIWVLSDCPNVPSLELTMIPSFSRQRGQAWLCSFEDAIWRARCHYNAVQVWYLYGGSFSRVVQACLTVHRNFALLAIWKFPFLHMHFVCRHCVNGTVSQLLVMKRTHRRYSWWCAVFRFI